jgi:heme exporter protein A
MLQLHNIEYDLPDRTLLKGVSLTLKPGQTMHLKGKNGVGKTTLLRIIAGLCNNYSGTITHGDAGNTAIDIEQTRVVLVAHNSGLSRCLSVKENYQTLYCVDEDSLDVAITQAGLSVVSREWTGNLSQGQQKRAALLRLLLGSEKIWLLDEPFVGLDKEGIYFLTGLLHKHLQKKGMVIMTSHQSLPESVKPDRELELV